MTATYLDEILERKRKEVRARSAKLDVADLRVAELRCQRDALAALRAAEGLAVIAEHKRASPSRGPIRPGSNAAEIARAYELAGANAISVLTDEAGFDGRPQDLIDVRAAVQLPVLCKDFIVSPSQIWEARIWGADIVLLIVAALNKKELSGLHRLATGLGMAVLVEVHDAQELATAVDVGATLIGVNNRNLHTFEVDLEVSEKLAPRFPDGVFRVSESGIRTAADLVRLRDAGYHGVLIGERFMQEPDPGAALSGLLKSAGVPRSAA